MLEKHVATCGFILVPCPKQCKEDNDAVKCLLKKDLEEHLETDCPNRDHECQHCGKKSPYAFIMQVHDGKCRKKVIPCTNAGCGDIIERQQVRKHVHTMCLYTMIPCKYKGIGCDTELKREDMAAHEQDSKLLHKALKTVHSQQSAIDSLQATVKSLQATVKSLQATVKSLQNNVNSLEKKHSMFESKTFKLSGYRKKKRTNERFQSQPFYTHPNGYHMALIVYANGNGDGEDTHVSVFAIILIGEYDTELKWPFVGKVTVTLLNQLQDMNHYTLVIPFDAIDSRRISDNKGFPTFIRHSALANDLVKNTLQYLKEDKLCFKVSVEVSDRKPWLE